MGKAPAEDLLACLPHGDAFRYLSAIRDIVPGESGEGVMRVIGDEPYLAAHFPGNPLVPGVLILEALAQLAGVVAFADSGTRSGMLAHANVRFKRSVAPPAEIALTARVMKRLGALVQCDVAATVSGAPVCRGELTMSAGGEAQS